MGTKECQLEDLPRMQRKQISHGQLTVVADKNADFPFVTKERVLRTMLAAETSPGSQV
jgi:hypothetical protein